MPVFFYCYRFRVLVFLKVIMNPDILNELETKINAGIASFDELDNVCSELINIIHQQNELAVKANELFEKLRPDWSSVAFQAWMIGEIL
ncbi:hypothetical protein FJR11_19550 [Anabaena sp. UHCC 0187]|nr:hypothetical protein [Anabaena sp. UHCC 0187]